MDPSQLFKGAFCLGRSKILLLRPHFTHIVETDVPNVTQGKRSRHRVILQLLAVILHLFLSKTVYDNNTKINFEKSSFIFEKFQIFSKKTLEIINILKFSNRDFQKFRHFGQFSSFQTIYIRTLNFQNWFSYSSHKPFLIKIGAK